MDNQTTIKIPKKYEGMLELIEKEGSEGYWAYSKEGYFFEGMQAHTAHEYNQKELMEMIRTLKPCDCEKCKEEETNKEEGDEMEKEENIEVVIAKAGQEPELTTIKNDLETLQSYVQGYIEIVMLSDRVTAVINEEGKLDDLTPNFHIPSDYVAGDVVFCGSDVASGEFISLTDKEKADVIGFLKRNQVKEG